MAFLRTSNQEENINTSIQIMNSVGINDYSYVGYSDANGVSVYFRNSKGIKIRISNHGVSNPSRMSEELHLSFDSLCLGLGGATSVKTSEFMNKFYAKKFGY